jgi:hypothetical protein
MNGHCYAIAFEAFPIGAIHDSLANSKPQLAFQILGVICKSDVANQLITDGEVAIDNWFRNKWSGLPILFFFALVFYARGDVLRSLMLLHGDVLSFAWPLRQIGSRYNHTGMTTELAQNGTRFEWTAPRRRAAFLLGQGELTDEQIAKEVGAGRRTLARWKNSKEFCDRVMTFAEHFGSVGERFEIGRRVNRLRALNDRWKRMQRVIDERGASPEMQSVAGGTTGLLVKTIKCVGSGDDSQLIDQFEVDTGLLKEIREHEKQAAMELGQIEKPVNGLSVGVNIVNQNGSMGVVNVIEEVISDRAQIANSFSATPLPS